MDKDEKKQEDKPIEEKPQEEKPNIQIKPPEFESQKHTYHGDTIKFIDKTKD